MEHGKMVILNGKIIYFNDEVYEGDVKNKEKNDYGVMIYYNGNEYKRNQKNNKRNLEGELINKKDNKKLNEIGYELKNGIIEYSNGEKYNGKINKNKRNGEGAMEYKNIGEYNDHWENIKKKGYGVWTRND